MKHISIFALLIFCLNNFAFSETIEVKGTITGRIISKMNKSPLTGVTVRVLNTTLGAISKSDGTFEIKNVNAGVQKVQFSLIGYEVFIIGDLSVNAGKPAFVEVELAEKVIELEGAEVRAAFFEKRVDAVTSTQFLTFEEIRRAPGVQEEVVRATALLPGVNVTAAGRNDLIVRGGAPFENLFIVDNIEVNNINHFGSQGSTGGPLSLINLDYVRSVEFSAGGFGASAEGPLGDNGSYIVSARRSYLDFIFQAAGFSFVPQYWDYMVKTNYRINQNNSLTFLTISAINNVKLNNEDLDNRYKNGRIAVPEQYQNFAGLTWRNTFDNGFFTTTLASSYTRFSTFQNDSNLVEIFSGLII